MFRNFKFSSVISFFLILILNQGCTLTASITSEQFSQSNQLVFQLQNAPTSATAFTALNSSFQMLIHDQDGAPFTTPDKVLVEIFTDPTGGAQLYGTTEVDVIAGVVNLSDLAIDLPGTQYVLKLTLGGQSIYSEPFDVEPAMVIVAPMFTINGSNFMDYLPQVIGKRIHQQEDRLDISSTIQIHGGEVRKVLLPEYSECDGLTIEEDLELFHWHCNDETSETYFYSRRFIEGKGLRDALNSNSFKSNKVTIFKSGTAVAESSLSNTWWTNPIVPLTLNSGGADPAVSLSASGTIYTVSSSGQSRGIRMTAAEVGLVTLGEGTEISNTATLATFDCQIDLGGTQPCFISGEANAGWIEISLNLSAATPGIHVASGQTFGQVYPNWRIHNTNVVSTNAGFAAVPIYLGSVHPRVTDTTVVSESVIGIQQYELNYAIFDNIKVTAKNGFGIYVDGAWYTTLNRIYTYNNGMDGINGFGYNLSVLNSVSTNNLESGLQATTSAYLVVKNSIFSNNGDSGIGIGSTGNELFVGNVLYGNTPNGFSKSSQLISKGYFKNNIISDNGTGITMSSSRMLDFSDNIIRNSQTQAITISGTSTDLVWTGKLILDDNAANCNVSSTGANPGLFNGTCANQGASSATLMTAVDTSNYLVGLTTDTENVHGATGSSIASALTDWTNFLNTFRTWTRSLPNTIGRCFTTDTCSIFDFSLSPSAAESLFINGVPVAGQTCPASVHGNQEVFSGTNGTLPNAIEIIGDLIGDDDGNCEDHEDCLFHPHIGLSPYTYPGELQSCIFEPGPNLTDIRIFFQ